MPPRIKSQERRATAYATAKKISSAVQQGAYFFALVFLKVLDQPRENRKEEAMSWQKEKSHMARDIS